MNPQLLGALVPRTAFRMAAPKLPLIGQSRANAAHQKVGRKLAREPQEAEPAKGTVAPGLV